MCFEKVEILLATYNGEKYLREQLDSILKQSYKNWFVRIRDDGSKDSTIEIIKEYREKYPEKFIFLEDNLKNLGVCLNFKELMLKSEAPYVMLCDQDDYWLENKIEITLNKMKESENIYGVNTPIYIHTDLTMVNSKLEIVYDSYWKFKNIDNNNAKETSFIILGNVATGCSTMMNRALVDISKNIPKEALMHDWWICIVASLLGQVISLPEKTILYRIHGNNVMGNLYSPVKRINIDYIYRGFKYFFEYKTELKNIQKRYIAQAKQLVKIENLPESKKHILKEYISLENSILPVKIYKKLKYKFFQRDRIRDFISLFLT